MRGLDVLRRANPAVAAKVQGQGGFLDENDLKVLAAAGPAVLVLVRCNGGRFLAPADQAGHFVKMIDEYGKLLEEKYPGNPLPPGTEWVRDVSLPAGVA